MVCIKAVINYLAVQSVIFFLLYIVYKERQFLVYIAEEIFLNITRNPQR
ncbi:hypothetical protein NEIG_00551 [Nematocida sp. ERTm5]|nr:hypothetical protein NEIG_00551 [Nematocida sp. ERTm5]